MRAKRHIALLPFLILCITIIFTSACDEQKQLYLPGYIEGKFTYISSNLAGILKSLKVAAGDKVSHGQALFSLEPQPENAELLVASARVQQALDQSNKSKIDYELQKSKKERSLYLFKRQVISKEELDDSLASYREAYAKKKASEASLAAEKANEAKAQWARENKIVNAPMQSLVFETYYTEHEHVPAGRPILSLLAPENIKIIFFAPENLIDQLKLNQIIYASCDSCKKPIKGRISYLSPNAEYTPPVIFSEQERSQLVFRIEALPLGEENPFDVHPGQPVTISLNENKPRK